MSYKLGNSEFLDGCDSDDCSQEVKVETETFGVDNRKTSFISMGMVADRLVVETRLQWLRGGRQETFERTVGENRVSVLFHLRSEQPKTMS